METGEDMNSSDPAATRYGAVGDLNGIPAHRYTGDNATDVLELLGVHVGDLVVGGIPGKHRGFVIPGDYWERLTNDMLFGVSIMPPREFTPQPVRSVLADWLAGERAFTEVFDSEEVSE